MDATAWILIVSTLAYGPNGMVALQGFSTKERCEAAAKFVKDDAAAPPGARTMPFLSEATAAAVRAKCVPK